MDNPVEIEYRGKIETVEGKPITLIVPDASMATHPLKYPGRFVITYEVAIQHIDFIKYMQKDTPMYLRKVFYDIFKDEDAKQAENLKFIKKCNDGIRHFAGRMDLTIQLIRAGIPLVWKYPEMGLHQRYQCELGDVIIHLANCGK